MQTMNTDERYMFLMIADSRVYVFKEEQGRAAAADYMRTYRGISDISFAEVRVPRAAVDNSRKLRGYVKLHWRECLIDNPETAETYNE